MRYGWCRAQYTHERGDGNTGYNSVVGRWSECHLPASCRTKRCAQPNVPGDGQRSAECSLRLWRNAYEWVNEKDLRSRYRYRWATAIVEYSARALLAPGEKRALSADQRF